MSILAGYTAFLEQASTLAGTGHDVRGKLEKVANDQVVAVVLPGASQASVDAIAQAFLNIAQLVPSLIEKQQQQTLSAIVEALVPKVVPTPTALKEAQMLAQARAAVLASGDWMTANEIAKVAGFSQSNPSAQPSKWKRDKAIFAISHGGVDYFPAYGLDPAAGYRPRKALANILQVFDGSKDGWGLAYWFMSPNSFLGGERPQDVLHTDPAHVAQAAADELAGVGHG